jgi:hypothetical protein
MTVPLVGSSLVATVDNRDWPKVKRHRWTFDKASGYPVTWVAYGEPIQMTNRVRRRRRKIRMHQLVMSTELEYSGGSFTPDHRDGDKLNNRRGNLRLATQLQQCANRKYVTNASGYKGVVPHNGRWSARIYAGDKPRRLGSFDDPADAARAYDAEARRIWGEFACTNFPEDHP